MRIAATALRRLPPVALIEHDLRILGHGEHSTAHATRMEAEAVPRHAVREAIHPVQGAREEQEAGAHLSREWMCVPRVPTTFAEIRWSGGTVEMV